MASNPPFDDRSDKDAVRPPDKNPTVPTRPDKPVEFPASDTAISQADGVP